MLYIIGERHDEYSKPEDRINEFNFLKANLGVSDYFTEISFRGTELSDDGETLLLADPLIEHQRTKLIACMMAFKEEIETIKTQDYTIPQESLLSKIEFNLESVNNKMIQFFASDITDKGKEYQKKNLPVSEKDRKKLENCVDIGNEMQSKLKSLKELCKKFNSNENFLFRKIKRHNILVNSQELLNIMHKVDQTLGAETYSLTDLDRIDEKVNKIRETGMFESAEQAAKSGLSAVYKIGQFHVDSFLKNNIIENPSFVIMSKNELSDFIGKSINRSEKNNDFKQALLETKTSKLDNHKVKARLSYNMPNQKKNKIKL